MLMLIISLCAAASGVTAAVLPLAQLKVLMKHKHGKALSLPYLFQAVASNGIWLAYGLMIHDLLLELSCAGGFVTGGILYLVAVRYRNHHPHRSVASIVEPIADDPARLAKLHAAVEVELARHAELAESPTLIIKASDARSGRELAAATA
jgi:uncharacterized protein with PQ loop repeat